LSRRALNAAVGLALTAAVVLAGCGSDDKGGKTGASSGATTPRRASFKFTEVPTQAPQKVSRAAVAPPAAARGSLPAARSAAYCSPTGDYCLGIRGSHGAALLSIATVAFRGTYRLCIDGPAGYGCQSFRLRPQGRGLFASTVRYEPAYNGRYTASWFKGGGKLGRSLFFHVS
jgi:hypothetical protein